MAFIAVDDIEFCIYCLTHTVKTPKLTYCTNVHPLQDFASWRRAIPFFAQKLSGILGWKPFPMGLWFNETVLEVVLKQGKDSFHKELEAWGVTTFTLNAFPQRNFHDPIVKGQVYQPDWTDSSRWEYTRRCADLLAELLPEGTEGSISTLPLGWRNPWGPAQGRLAAEALIHMALHLEKLFRITGRHITLALEPEPGCVLETISQVIDFWNDFLRPAAKTLVASAELDAYLGICFDTCHQAVQFEDPVVSLNALRQAGISVHKMQLSNALEFSPDPKGLSRGQRSPFVEPRFLHQTKIHSPQGLLAFDDLPLALDSDAELFAHPWRIHYHVPIHMEFIDPNETSPNLTIAPIRTTRQAMLDALGYALHQKMCFHFEVETYTWNVLPKALRPTNDESLAICLAQELQFILQQFPEFSSTTSVEACNRT